MAGHKPHCYYFLLFLVLRRGDLNFYNREQTLNAFVSFIFILFIGTLYVYVI